MGVYMRKIIETWLFLVMFVVVAGYIVVMTPKVLVDHNTIYRAISK
jgi:uncharacterized membrane protein YraQ (UPF0718 family)